MSDCRCRNARLKPTRSSSASLSSPPIFAEERFIFPEFLKEAGVVGVINVPILLPGGTPYGLLQVDSREAWHPDEEDIQFLRTYAMILGPVIDRLFKVHDLQEALDANRTLLRELQHRIKNNIAAITSLVRLRVDAADTEDARRELRVIGERIETLRLVHEQVHAGSGVDHLELCQYVTALLTGLLDLHREITVKLDAEIEEMDISSDRAIPLGLILNEFTTNSLKYAFDEAGGTITVRAMRVGDTRISITIADDGRGLPPEPLRTRPASGTGMGLIAGLARQLRAEVHWEAETGTGLRLEFKNE
ncbi:sensor histidine kinase [Sphingomonas sp. PB4P5]|uniref:sensor histidine kinase n=1 Tax=Parasphingomonas puruogangriensis TaxID=3096155 RepID=UPI002FCA0F42